MDRSPLVRPVAPQDLEALTDMVRQLARFHGDTPSVTPATLARDCLGQAPWLHVLVVEEQGALCGYAMLCPRARAQFGERAMELHHLYVHRGRRGRGLGRALIEGAEARARELGASMLSLSVMAENEAAGAAYLACGFEEVTGTGARRFRRYV